MGLPEQVPTAEQMLDFLDASKGKHLLSIGNTWYTRKSWGQPVRRHASLREAVLFAMINRRMREGEQ